MTSTLSTDYHCHILPGIDDGPATIEESIEMAKELLESGFSTICCTPHRIKGTYDTSPDRVRRETRQLHQALARAGIPLKLIPGTEYYLDEFLLDLLKDPLLLPGNLLLVEIWPACDPQLIIETLDQVVRQGITPLIAHPERCDLLAARKNHTAAWGGLGALFKIFGKEPLTENSTARLDPSEGSLLESLLSLGCRFQGNLGSFAGLYGPRVQRKAETFQEMGLYSHFGSDLHRPGVISAYLDSLPRL